MSTPRNFDVFGEPVEVRMTSEEGQGSFSVVVQTSPPGGGPPIHTHLNEDEVFTVLEGEYELYNGTSWTPLACGQTAFMLRGSTHTFRNVGQTEGKMHTVVIPGTGFENYLYGLSKLKMPQDKEKLEQLSIEYGIGYPEHRKA